MIQVSRRRKNLLYATSDQVRRVICTAVPALPGVDAGVYCCVDEHLLPRPTTCWTLTMFASMTHHRPLNTVCFLLPRAMRISNDRRFCVCVCVCFCACECVCVRACVSARVQAHVRAHPNTHSQSHTHAHTRRSQRYTDAHSTHKTLSCHFHRTVVMILGFFCNNGNIGNIGGRREQLVSPREECGTSRQDVVNNRYQYEGQ